MSSGNIPRRREFKMVDAPAELAQRVRDQITEDMRPSYFTMYMKSGLAVLIGGVVSLLICGQFGFGITHAAQHFNDQLHEHVHDFASAFLSGAVFAFLSPFLLRLFCSPLQYRVIIRHLYIAPIWFVGLGAILAHHGQMGFEVGHFALWCFATTATFKMLSMGLDKLMGKRFFHMPSEVRVRH
jgi:hypothetical protein